MVPRVSSMTIVDIVFGTWTARVDEPRDEWMNIAGERGMDPFASDIIVPEAVLKRKRLTKRRANDISDADYRVIGNADRGAGLEIVNDNKPKYDHRRSVRKKISLVIGGAIHFGVDFGERIVRYMPLVAGVTFVILAICLIVPLFGHSSPKVVPLPNKVTSIDRGPLIFHQLNKKYFDSNGFRVVEITGIIENRSTIVQHVPAIRVDVISPGSSISSAGLNLNITSLSPGVAVPFTARLPVKGDEGDRISLSFL